jgi:adenylate kinase family enzyme
MEKVAVFGNAGGGKSTLSRRLADITGLPLYVLDKIQFQAGGVPVPAEDFQAAHQQILSAQQWIIDGFGSIETLWPRLAAADTLVYVDLPLPLHFSWVTKRFLTGFWQPPAGWPENSPLLQSSLNSYRALWLCHQHLTPKYRQYVEQARTAKPVYHLRSPGAIAQFLKSMEHGVAKLPPA